MYGKFPEFFRKNSGKFPTFYFSGKLTTLNVILILQVTIVSVVYCNSLPLPRCLPRDADYLWFAVWQLILLDLVLCYVLAGTDSFLCSLYFVNMIWWDGGLSEVELCCTCIVWCVVIYWYQLCTLWVIKNHPHCLFVKLIRGGFVHIWKTWTDFNSFFTVAFCNELWKKPLYNLAFRLKSVAALNCKIWLLYCTSLQQSYSVQKYAKSFIYSKSGLEKIMI